VRSGSSLSELRANIAQQPEFIVARNPGGIVDLAKEQ
jgi:hypothetical protein